MLISTFLASGFGLQIISYVISFVVRQLDKWGDRIDWELVKADAKERISALIPGTFFDSFGEKLVCIVIDKVSKALDNETLLSELLADLAAGKWSEVIADLEQIVKLSNNEEISETITA